MKYVFSSVFAHEMERYLRLLSEAGRYILQIQSSLRSLDGYLTEIAFRDGALYSETVSAWLKTRNVSAGTKAQDIACIKGFARFLVSLGIQANCPESPKIQSTYVPYLFSDEELARIFSVADNFEAGMKVTRSALIFPILLRLLYGCGLRLGEGRSVRWKDVDLENGVVTIRESKNMKQRFVPMDASMAEILRNYRAMVQADGICGDYLFESHCNPGEPFRNNTFYEWFMKTLDAAGIRYAKHNNRERGPCPHSLRHCFTHKSFLKSEGEGRRFEDTAPFLAAFLGHGSPKETEAYLSSNHSV